MPSSSHETKVDLGSLHSSQGFRRDLALNSTRRFRSYATSETTVLHMSGGDSRAISTMHGQAKRCQALKCLIFEQSFKMSL